MPINKMRIARVSTVPFFVVTQLGAQIDALSKAGACVSVIASDDSIGKSLKGKSEFDFIPVEISRDINLIVDIRSLFHLFRLFRKSRFDIVHSTTPKAGLLCAIAGLLAGVPVRLHTFTGQPWATMVGFKRSLLKFCDKIIGSFNTRCYADSSSQRDFLIDSHVVKSEKILVFGQGSLAGVDLKRFDPLRYSSLDKISIRQDLGIPNSAQVILFVGRVTKDKGVAELVQAFKQVLDCGCDVYLVVVGPCENDGQVILDINVDCIISERIKVVGYSEEPEKYMAISDLLCIPSYREGFGTVVIEAAAMGVPTVASNIYGLSDAVINHETGILVPVRNCAALAKALTSLLCDINMLHDMSNKARLRAVNFFNSDYFSQRVINEYRSFFN